MSLCGRNPALHPVAKRMIAMAANKSYQSMQKLACRLTQAGHSTLKSSVHRYYYNKFEFQAYKLYNRQKMSDEQRLHWLKFA